MAIYDIFEFDKKEEAPPEAETFQASVSRRDRFFSSLTARLFFLLLLVADLLWFCYAVGVLICSSALLCATLFKSSLLKKIQAKMWLTIKRALVCAISLLITLFSPAFGIMVACTYFLMYDKAGIEEVVPTSLQAQFKEFFKES